MYMLDYTVCSFRVYISIMHYFELSNSLSLSLSLYIYIYRDILYFRLNIHYNYMSALFGLGFEVVC